MAKESSLGTPFLPLLPSKSRPEAEGKVDVQCNSRKGNSFPKSPYHQANAFYSKKRRGNRQILGLLTRLGKQIMTSQSAVPRTFPFFLSCDCFQCLAEESTSRLDIERNRHQGQEIL